MGSNRLQFRLSWFLLFIALASLFIWLIAEVRGKNEHFHAIRASGGVTDIDSEWHVLYRPRFVMFSDASLLGKKEFNHLQNLDSVKAIYINCRGSSIPDLKLLRNIDQLRQIVINNPGPQILQQVGSLTQLEVIKVEEAVVDEQSFESLSRLRRLKQLAFVNCKFQDVGLNPFEGIYGLRRLDLSHSSISGIEASSLLGLTELEELDLSDTKITQEWIACIARLNSLRELSLANIGGTEHDFSAIANLSSLERLSIDDSSSRGVSEIRRKLPSCEIRALFGGDCPETSGGDFSSSSGQDFDDVDDPFAM